MSNPKPPPTRSGGTNANGTRQRILQVAAEAWHKNSFDGVGTAEICRLAGVHKGSFFHFFPSKQALLLAVLELYQNGLQAQLRTSSFAADTTPLARFERFFAGMAEAIDQQIKVGGCVRGCPIGNLALELSTRNPQARQAAADAFDQVQIVFEETLRDAIAAGELPAHDTKATAAGVLAWMQGLAVLGKTYGITDQLRTLGTTAIAMIRALATATRA